MAERLFESSEAPELIPDPVNAKARASIELRRFAGSARHVGALDRVRVAHLTDMHFGRVTPERVQREAVAITNGQRPDLVVITGDFVCHSQMYLEQLVSVLRAIRAPVVGVLGNHDYWSGAAEVRLALARAGVEVLSNAHTVLTLKRQRLQVVGLDDAYTGHADREKAVRGLRRDLPTLGLSHIAEQADGLWHAGVPLVLSGHTHAGQVTLARLHELAVGRIAGHRYIHGLYGAREPRSAGPKGAVYVGAGIGSSVMPVRLGERGRREVTVFDLGAPPGLLDEHHAEQTAHRGRSVHPAVTARRHRFVLKKEAERNGKRKERPRR